MASVRVAARHVQAADHAPAVAVARRAQKRLRAQSTAALRSVSVSVWPQKKFGRTRQSRSQQRVRSRTCRPQPHPQSPDRAASGSVSWAWTHGYDSCASAFARHRGARCGRNRRRRRLGTSSRRCRPANAVAGRQPPAEVIPSTACRRQSTMKSHLQRDVNDVIAVRRGTACRTRRSRCGRSVNRYGGRRTRRSRGPRSAGRSACSPVLHDERALVDAARSGLVGRRRLDEQGAIEPHAQAAHASSAFTRPPCCQLIQQMCVRCSRDCAIEDGRSCRRRRGRPSRRGPVRMIASGTQCWGGHSRFQTAARRPAVVGTVVIAVVVPIVVLLRI